MGLPPCVGVIFKNKGDQELQYDFYYLYESRLPKNHRESFQYEMSSEREPGVVLVCSFLVTTLFAAL